MGNRKLPFGYKMEMGEIVLHPQEAELVEQIFRQYIAGGTYGTMVAGLRDQPIPYDEGKIWNKNMVARILEDRRYTGENGYPAIIEDETLERALEKRSTRQATIQVTEAQKILRRLSGCTSTKRVERQVLGLLNTLIRNPERIVPPKTSVQANEPQLQRELDTVMACQPINEDSAQKLILAIAATQYSAIGSDEYESTRLRRLFAQHQPMTELDAELLRSTVSAIQVYGDGTLDVRLKNNQTIGRSEKR